jgi:chemotaxis methyl-accepting protein methylase
MAILGASPGSTGILRGGRAVPGPVSASLSSPEGETVVDRFRHVTFFEPRLSAPPAALHLGAPVAPRRAAATRALAAADPAATNFIHDVLGEAGIEPSCYRIEPLLRRVPACLRTLRAGSLEDAHRRVQSDRSLRAAALSSLVNGVTEFFRDPAVFEFLDQHTLRDAARRARPVGVLSAGCSDGAELYSVAMLLAEHGLLADSELCGIDCRREAVAAARAGRYDEVRMSGLDAARRARFFQRRRAVFQVCDELRRAARWQTGDVVRPAGLASGPAGGWDVILCRNLAIYLEPAAAASMWCALANRLRPGGVLVVGKAERPAPIAGLCRLAPCIFQRI